MEIPKTVMLVDDDLDDQYLFMQALNEVYPSIDCVCANTAEKALDDLQQNPLPDYLFLDLNLPLMDGLTFLRLIKEKERLRDIPVVIYSTSSRITDIEKAKELSAKDYIQKPSTFHELITVMHRLFPVAV